MPELTTDEIKCLGNIRFMQNILLRNSGKIAKLRGRIADLVAECDRLRAELRQAHEVPEREAEQTIRDFLAWLDGKILAVCAPTDCYEYYPVSDTPDALIEWFLRDPRAAQPGSGAGEEGGDQ